MTFYRALFAAVAFIPWAPAALAALSLPAPIVTLLVNLAVSYAPQLLAGVVAALALVVAKLLMHLKSTKARHAALALTDAARAGALYVEAKVAPALRGPDGKLSPAAGAQAKTAAVAAALEYLTAHGLEDVKAALGKTDAELEADLGLKVELASAAPSGNAITPDRATVILPSGRKLVVAG